MLTMRELILDDILESLDVPMSAYYAAERRYRDLGEWLSDCTKAESASFAPHVFAQGSFRLGTVTRPWRREDYDLDLACKLQEGITKSTNTQEELKQLVGGDLGKYRSELGIKEALEEKHRCWRLNYQDTIRFHMDIVPAIPEAEDQRYILAERMAKSGTDGVLARNVAEQAMAITDDRHPEYGVVTPDWKVSNQEGYALWFESRMRQARRFLEQRMAMVDDLPSYQWRTPLQQCIQILKRHRDIMFENDPDDKPISAIITTLAARSYNGESNVEMALSKAVEDMASFVNSSIPRVPNPVNPQEDFADKWALDPRLERNFWCWLDQVKRDFAILAQDSDIKLLTETVHRRFGADFDEPRIKKLGALLPKAVAITSGTAFTGIDGTIGAIGVQNPPHKFYG